MNQNNLPPEWEQWRARRRRLADTRRALMPLGWILLAREMLMLLLAILTLPLLSELFAPGYIEKTGAFSPDAHAVVTVALPLIGLIPVSLFARNRGLPLRCEAREKPGARDAGLFLLAMFGLSVVGTVGLILTEGFFNAAGYSVLIDDLIIDDTALSRILTIAYAAILAPIVEEYIYRGVVIDCLRPWGEHFAVLVSAMLFGLAHGNLNQLLNAALIGYFLGYVCIKTGSWRLGVLLHAANNIYALGMETLIEHLPETAANTVANAEWIVMGILGLMALMGVRKRWGRLDTEADTATVSALWNLPMALILAYALFNIITLIKPV